MRDNQDAGDREERRLSAAIWIIALAGMAVFGWAIWASIGEARAHDWYPISCCYGTSRNGDCAPIPASAVREGPDGYEVHLRPGDHPMVKEPITFVYPYADTRDSPDGRYHVCFRPDMTPRCFFAGARVG